MCKGALGGAQLSRSGWDCQLIVADDTREDGVHRSGRLSSRNCCSTTSSSFQISEVALSTVLKRCRASSLGFAPASHVWSTLMICSVVKRLLRNQSSWFPAGSRTDMISG